MTTNQEKHEVIVVKQTPADAVYWRLLAVALDPGRETPELYGLIREGQSDVPLMVDGRILLFAERGRADELLRRHGRLVGDEVVDVERPFFVCDVAQALHLLSVGGLDSDSAVLSAVNVLLDLVVATGVPFDERRWLGPFVLDLGKLPDAVALIFRQTEAEPLWVGGPPPGTALFRSFVA